jgi:hypothetical protein
MPQFMLKGGRPDNRGKRRRAEEKRVKNFFGSMSE